MNRKFDKTSIQIADENKQFEQDLLSEGRTKAEFNRKQRKKILNQTSKNIGKLIGYIKINPKTGKEEFIRI